MGDNSLQSKLINIFEVNIGISISIHLKKNYI